MTLRIRSLFAAIAIASLGACASPGAPGGLEGGLTTIPSQSDAALEARIRALGRTITPPETGALYAPRQARAPYAGVAVVRDLRYGPDARHLLDVFTPEGGGGARPVLVFVHGGAFTRGDRRGGPDSPYYDNLMVWAVRNGMVGVNMTYRLAPAATWPAAQEDIADALRWVKANVAARGGDPAKIWLMGHSAGAAHVAQYVGHPRFHIEPGSGLAGAILVSGIFDPSSSADGAGAVYFGGDKAVQATRSALPGMVASRVPMLFAHAELDPDAFHQQADQARKALCVPGRPCPPFLLLQGQSHMSEVYGINSGDRSLSDPLRRFVMGR